MGIEFSLLDILSSAVKPNTKTTHPDGTVVECTRNTEVLVVTSIGAFLILFAMVDKGTGVFSKVLGRKCIECCAVSK